MPNANECKAPEGQDTIKDPDEPDATKSTIEELYVVILFANFPKRKFYMGSGLNRELRAKFIKFLLANTDYFAWFHDNMTGISMEVMTHKLSIDLKHLPVKKKKRESTYHSVIRL